MFVFSNNFNPISASIDFVYLLPFLSGAVQWCQQLARLKVLHGGDAQMISGLKCKFL